MNVSQIILIVPLVIIAVVLFIYRDKIQKFVSEAIVELKKVSWTTRPELVDATWIVIVSSAMLGVYIAVIDFALSRVLALIVR